MSLGTSLASGSAGIGLGHDLNGEDYWSGSFEPARAATANLLPNGTTPSGRLEAVESLVKRVLKDDSERRACRCVMYESNVFRKAWNLLMFPILLYVGTLMPFRLVFLEFYIEGRIDVGQVWRALEIGMEFVFAIDLVLPFLFTYRDILNREVTSLHKIALNYVRGTFFVNFVACFPPEFAEWVLGNERASEEASGNHLHKGVRFFRIQRVMRVIRLFRLLRVFHYLQESPTWRWFRSLRGVRILKFVASLLWVIHLAACGWYLVASLHDLVEDTWPYRNFNSSRLIAEAGPLSSWMYSYYFALTVFTTVGFGDISPETTGEILYCCFIMMAGAVINGLVVSEIITVITSSSKIKSDLQQQEKLITEFCRQTQLSTKAQGWLTKWIATHRSVQKHEVDRDKLQQLFIGGTFPREIIGKLPNELYRGKLTKNKFITLIQHTRRKEYPVQLPIFVSIAGDLRHYERGEVVYYGSDLPWSVFIILDGSFAHVGAVLMKSKSEDMAKAPSIRSVAGFDEKHQGTLFPYLVLSFGNYFGDEEIMLRRKHRRSCVRCESSGTLLVLTKNDWMLLAQEFPDIAHIWRSNALRKERSRERRTTRFSQATELLNYQELCIRILQRWYRSCRRFRRSRNESRRRTSQVMSSLAKDVSMTGAEGLEEMFPAEDQALRSSQALVQKVESLSFEVSSLKSSIAELIQGQRILVAATQKRDGVLQRITL